MQTGIIQLDVEAEVQTEAELESLQADIIRVLKSVKGVKSSSVEDCIDFDFDEQDED